MENKVIQILQILEDYSQIEDSHEGRGPLYALQTLSKETPRDVYLLALKQAVLADIAKGKNKIAAVMEDVDPSILEDSDVKEALSKLAEAQNAKGWEV